MAILINRMIQLGMIIFLQVLNFYDNVSFLFRILNLRLRRNMSYEVLTTHILMELFFIKINFNNHLLYLTLKELRKKLWILKLSLLKLKTLILKHIKNTWFQIVSINKNISLLIFKKLIIIITVKVMISKTQMN